MFTVSSKDEVGDWLTADFSATSAPAYFGKLGSWRYLPQTSVDMVFSRRTGRQKKGTSAVTYNSYVNSRGSLAEKLKARKALTEEALRENFKPGSNSGPTHFSLTDEGNPFSVVHRKRWIVSDQITYSGVNFAVVDSVPVTGLPDKNGIPVVGTGTFSGFNWSGMNGVTSLSTATASSVAVPSAEKTKLQTELISNLNPYRNEMGGITMIGELALGGFPKAFKRLQDYRAYRTNPGGTDLEVRFGLAPLANDIYNLLMACLRLDLMLVERSARRKRRFVYRTYDWVNNTLTSNQRRVGFPTQVGSGTSVVSPVASLGKCYTNSLNPAYDMPVSFVQSYQKGFRFCHQEVEINFTARYNNGVKPTPSLNGYVDRALELLGMEITPDVVYNLTPWTWMLDWFTNLGSVVNYCSNFGLSNNVLDYAYFTQRITTKRGTMLWSPPITTVSKTGMCMITEETEEIDRIQATPLGFGVVWPELTQSQLDVLTAFGITRPR